MFNIVSQSSFFHVKKNREYVMKDERKIGEVDCDCDVDVVVE